MSKTPEVIYLIPGEDIDGVMGWLWCDDPAPSKDHDPNEAVKYVRADKVVELQAAVLDQACSDIGEMAYCPDVKTPHGAIAKAADYCGLYAISIRSKRGK